MAGQVQGDQEKAAVTVQVGRDGGQGQVEGRGGHTLQPASALLIIASREGKAGSFPSSGFWSSLQSQKCDGRPPVSRVEENEDFWSTLSLGPSRGRCGAVSAG